MPGEIGYSEVRCGRWHTGIPMRGADPKLIDSITPDMFIKDDDERVNNLYKEAEEISNNAGDTKEEEK